MTSATYPVVRDMDGVYFRVKRDGEFKAICWSDLIDDERDQMGEGRPLEWWRNMALIMTRQLRWVADELDLSMEVCDD